MIDWLWLVSVPFILLSIGSGDVYRLREVLSQWFVWTTVVCMDQAGPSVHCFPAFAAAALTQVTATGQHRLCVLFTSMKWKVKAWRTFSNTSWVYQNVKEVWNNNSENTPPPLRTSHFLVCGVVHACLTHAIACCKKDSELESKWLSNFLQSSHYRRALWRVHESSYGTETCDSTWTRPPWLAASPVLSGLV